MGSGEVTIRQATPGDVGLFYELLIMSSPFLEIFFGPMHEEVLKHLFCRRKNLFSYEHTWVAEAGGKIAGMFLGYGYREKKGEEASTVLKVMMKMQLWLVMQIPIFLKCAKTADFAKKGDYYLSNIAVFPEFRGKGVAGELMQRAEREAKSRGAVRITLDVEADNAGALRFYEKEGFSVAEEFTLAIGAGKRILRMAKHITA